MRWAFWKYPMIVNYSINISWHKASQTGRGIGGLDGISTKVSKGGILFIFTSMEMLDQNNPSCL